MGELTITYLDYDGEKSPFKITTSTPVAAGFDTWNTEIGAVVSALANITLGNVNKTVRSSTVTPGTNDTPASEIAQRESKWLVTYRDTTTEKLFRCEIPTADLVGHLLPASQEADLTETDMAAFVTAFEQLARSPDDVTHAVEVMSIRHVGRNI